MSGYTKLFGSILASTVWELPVTTKVVWITMLAMADKHGEVQASVPGLAKFAGVSRTECELALESFLAPDPDSRTKDADGRRIEPIDGGWRLLNHGKYTQMLSADDKRERAAERQRRSRESRSVTHSHASSPVVAPGPACHDTQTQTQTETKTKTKTQSKSGALASLCARDFIAAFCEEWSKAYQEEKYKVSKQDSGQVATMVKESPGLSLLEWRAACARYVRSQKPFYLDSRHPIRLLCMSLNEFSGDVKPISKLERKTADNREMFLQGQEWAAGK